MSRLLTFIAFLTLSGPTLAQQAAPVARPIQGEAGLPVLAPAVVDQNATVVSTPEPVVAPKLTKDGKKAADAAAKRLAEYARAAQKKAEQDRRDMDKLEKERAVRDAEVAKKNAELAKKKAEEDQKKDRALAEAAARLKQAQAAYQAEMEKAKEIKK